MFYLTNTFVLLSVFDTPSCMRNIKFTSQGRKLGNKYIMWPLCPHTVWIEEIQDPSRVGSHSSFLWVWTGVIQPTSHTSGISDCCFYKHVSLVSSEYFCGRRRPEITKRTSPKIRTAFLFSQLSENKPCWVCLHLWTSSHNKETSCQTVQVHKHRRRR